MKHIGFLAKAAASILLAGTLIAAPAAQIPGTENAVVMGTAVTAEAKAKKTSIKISASKVTLEMGKTKTLSVKNGKKAVKGVKWTTSNKNVATVDKNGKVKAVAAGTATIKGTYKKKAYSCKVTVRGLTSSSKTLNTGKSFTVSLKNLTKAQTKKTIKWTTSNKNVVAIKKASKTKYTLTAKKAGTAKVTAQIGKTKYTCTVKVTAPKKSTSSKSTSSNTASTQTNSTASTTEHVHNWVAKTTKVQTGTKTVVDEEAYDEPELAYRGVCDTCGFVFPAIENYPIDEHMYNHAINGEGTAFYTTWVTIGTIHHDAVTHEEPVYETVTTYTCSTCGAVKS